MSGRPRRFDKVRRAAIILRVPVQFRHAAVGRSCCARPRAAARRCRQRRPTDPPKSPARRQSPHNRVDGVTLPVTYPPATVVGGMTPVATQCVPASAGDFPIGSTVVTCTATDARSRTDSCTFSVTVTAAAANRRHPFRGVRRQHERRHTRVVRARSTVGDPGPPVGYAFKLKALLKERYTAQTFSVTDEGRGRRNRSAQGRGAAAGRLEPRPAGSAAAARRRERSEWRPRRGHPRSRERLAIDGAHGTGPGRRGVHRHAAAGTPRGLPRVCARLHRPGQQPDPADGAGRGGDRWSISIRPSRVAPRRISARTGSTRTTRATS